MNVIAGALVTLALVALDLPDRRVRWCSDSRSRCSACCSPTITAVAAQVTENTRVVYGIGGRGARRRRSCSARSATSATARSRGSHRSAGRRRPDPFAGEMWWPFLIIVGATGLLAWLAIALSRRRDLGAGLDRAAGRPRRAPRRPSGRPLGLATRLQRGSLDRLERWACSCSPSRTARSPIPSTTS